MITELERFAEEAENFRISHRQEYAASTVDGPIRGHRYRIRVLFDGSGSWIFVDRSGEHEFDNARDALAAYLNAGGRLF